MELVGIKNAPRTNFDFKENPIGESSEVICPVCGDTYSHHGDVEIFDRGEDHPEGNYVRFVDSNSTVITMGGHKLQQNPSRRRQGITIHMQGECGHNFLLHIYQHKGMTYIGTE